MAEEDEAVLYSSEPLLDVYLGSDSQGCKVSSMAWCRTSNLLAVALEHHQECTGFRSVRIIDPESPDEHTELQVPVSNGKTDWAAISHMAWAPRGCARALMICDNMGTITSWTHSTKIIRTINEWAGERVGDVGCWVTTAKWLEPPTSYKWPADPIKNLDAPLTPERSLETRHKPPKTSLHGSPLLWQRTGLPCMAAVGADSGRLHVWYKEYQAPSWSALEPYQLQLGALLAADVVATLDGAIRIAVVQAEYPHVVAVLEVTGHAESGALPMRAPIAPQAKLQMRRLCTVSPAMRKGFGAQVQVAFSPTQGGQSVLSVAGGGSLPQVVVQRWAPPNNRGTGKSHYTWESCAVAPIAAKPPGQDDSQPTSGRGKKKPARRVEEDDDDDFPRGPTLHPSWEGLVAVRMPGGRHLKLLDAVTLNSVDDLEAEKMGGIADGEQATVAFSPNGCCVAVAAGRGPPPKPDKPGDGGGGGDGAGGDGSEGATTPRPEAGGGSKDRGVRILRVKEGPGSLGGGRTPEERCRQWAVRAADRCGWGLYSGRHFWDTVASLRGGVAQAGGGKWLRQASCELDRAFHTVTRMRRPAYSSVLDRLKLVLLKGNPDDGPATALSLDLQARCILTALEAMVKGALAKPADLLAALPELAGGPQSLAVEPEVVYAMRPWCEWAVGYTVFFLRCLRHWVAVSRESGAGSVEAASVPCARLLPDQYFQRKLISVLIFAGLCDLRHPPAVKSTPPAPVANTAAVMLQMLRQVCGKAQQVRQQAPSAGQAPAGEGTPEFVSDLASAEAAGALLDATVRLHYPQAVGAVGHEQIAGIVEDAAVAGNLGPAPEGMAELVMFARSLGLQPADETPAFRTPAAAPLQAAPPGSAGFPQGAGGGGGDGGAPSAPVPGGGGGAGVGAGGSVSSAAAGGGGGEGQVGTHQVSGRLDEARRKLDEARRKRWRDEHDLAFGREAKPPPAAPPSGKVLLLRDAVGGYALPSGVIQIPGAQPLMCSRCHRKTVALPRSVGESCPKKRALMHAWSHGCPACGGIWRALKTE